MLSLVDQPSRLFLQQEQSRCLRRSSQGREGDSICIYSHPRISVPSLFPCFSATSSRGVLFLVSVSVSAWVVAGQPFFEPSILYYTPLTSSTCRHDLRRTATPDRSGGPGIPVPTTATNLCAGARRSEYTPATAGADRLVGALGSRAAEVLLPQSRFRSSDVGAA